MLRSDVKKDEQRQLRIFICHERKVLRASMSVDLPGAWASLNMIPNGKRLSHRVSGVAFGCGYSGGLDGGAIDTSGVVFAARRHFVVARLGEFVDHEVRGWAYPRARWMRVLRC